MINPSSCYGRPVDMIKWHCSVCGVDFEPTPFNIAMHTYHDTIIWRCRKCNKLCYGFGQVKDHKHKVFTLFDEVRLRQVPIATREGKVWLWDKMRKGVSYTKLSEFAKQATAQAEKQRKEKFGESWKPSIGENKIRLRTDEEIREVTGGQYGDAYSIPIAIGKKKYSWLVNVRSPIVRMLAKSINEEKLDIVVVRTGEGKGTKYAVK